MGPPEAARSNFQNEKTIKFKKKITRNTEYFLMAIKAAFTL
jgi:hypothetical protein